LSPNSGSEGRGGAGFGKSSARGEDSEGASTRKHSASSAPADRAEFEYQELRVQLDAMMKKSGSTSRDLDPLKKLELTSYVREVVAKRPSPVPLEDIGRYLPGTKWKLAFSNDVAASMMNDLPKDTAVTLDFFDNNGNNGKNELEYALEFGPRTFGLKNLKARSTWEVVDVDGSSRPGLVSFVYDKITADAFGFANVGVGLFGMLKGRTNYVETAYFDGSYWIEGGVVDDGGGGRGSEFWNVYVKV